MIHIDTHIFEALHKGWPRRIANRSRALIGDQAIGLSPVVIYELIFISRKTGLADPLRAFQEFARNFDAAISPARLDKVVEASLALAWTREPFDRLIVANAIVDGVGLVTKDELIRSNFPGAVW